jgi:cation transport regulator ChaC
MITRKAIEERLVLLRRDEAALTASINQTTANLQATHGAIQDCEFWLQQIGPERVTDEDQKAAS